MGDEVDRVHGDTPRNGKSSSNSVFVREPRRARRPECVDSTRSANPKSLWLEPVHSAYWDAVRTWRSWKSWRSWRPSGSRSGAGRSPRSSQIVWRWGAVLDAEGWVRHGANRDH